MESDYQTLCNILSAVSDADRSHPIRNLYTLENAAWAYGFVQYYEEKGHDSSFTNLAMDYKNPVPVEERF